jgi:hypothetical protein
MKPTMTRACSWFAVAACAGLLITGCDDESDNGGLTLTPESATVHVATKESVALTASNAVGELTWVLLSTNMGNLSVSGTRAVYTATANTGQNVVTVTDELDDEASTTISQVF